MIKKILSFLFFTSMLLPVIAQNIDNNAPGTLPVAKATSHGIWIYLGNKLPKNSRYQIERKQVDKSRYEVLGKTEMPKSLREMEILQQKWYPYFEKLDSLQPNEITKEWAYIQKNLTTDSLITSDLPLMHLIAGTAFLDTTAETGKSYIYRVTLSGDEVNKKETRETPAVSMPADARLPEVYFSHSKYADGKLEIQWSVKDPMELSHYNIYRSIFGENAYKRINIEKGIFSRHDSLMLLVIDTIGKQPSWYEYMLEPVDIYGNAGKLQGYCTGGSLLDYYAPPVSNLMARGSQKDHQVRLSWRYKNKKYLNGITIMRSMIFDSGYTKIATVPPSDTTYMDIVPTGGENYYYYLILYSGQSDPVATAKVAALYSAKSEKPDPPAEIDAQTIINGVKVYWKSEAPYASGFYVYRKENPEQGFVQVSGLIPSGASVYSFTDTSKNLQAGEVYQYIVRTVSDNNLLSNSSDTVSANPGIKVKLSSPMHLRYRSENGDISLIWDDMRQIDNDLLGYKIYRKLSAEKNFTRIGNDSLQAEKNFFIDSTLTPGIQYEYGVSVIDYFGNESPLSIIDVSVNENLPAAPSGITASASGNEIVINWGQIAGDDISSVRIYRSEPGQKAKVIGTIDAAAEEFTDKNVSNGKLYFYQLSSITNKNKEGILSEKTSTRL